MRELGTLFLEWFATAWLHGAALLACAWLAERAGALAAPAVRELVWRTALLAPLLTASVQLGVLARIESAPQPPRLSVPLEAPAAHAQDEGTYVGAAPRPASAAAAPAADNSVQRTNALAADAPRRESHASSSSSVRVERPVQWTWPARADLLALAGLAWALLAALALARVGFGIARTLRIARAFAPLDDPALHALAQRLARDARCAAPRLVLARELASPVAIAPRTICVPDWALTQLGPDQREAMLAHEVAHLSRRDPWWRIALALAAALLPIPGSARMRARLEELAEHACDAWGADASGKRRALAECLAACMERHSTPWLATHAVAMAGPRSPVVERVQRLIEEQPMKFESVGGPRRLLLVAAVAAAVLVLPGVALELVAAERGTSVQRQTNLFGASSTKIQVTDDDYELEVDASGDFRFNAAEDDVEMLEAGAELEIEEDKDGRLRRIVFENEGGKIVRRYWLEGSEHAWDADARAWLAALLPRVMRESGIDAEGRVDRIHARGGAPAVIAEIDLITSDHVRGTYLSLLFAKGPLQPAELDRLIAVAGALGSDYERRNVFTALLEAQDLDAPRQAAVLGVAGKLSSDYERRLLLEAAAKKLAPAAREAWFAALERMVSDYERRTALESLVSRAGNDADTMRLAIAATREMASDYERRTVLSGIAPNIEGSDELATSYARAAAAMGSDYERREALVALLGEQQKMSAGASAAVLDAIAAMGSDYEARVVLVELAERMPGDAALIKRYRAVSRGLGDYERGQAEKALDRFDG